MKKTIALTMALMLITALAGCTMQQPVTMLQPEQTAEQPQEQTQEQSMGQDPTQESTPEAADFPVIPSTEMSYSREEVIKLLGDPDKRIDFEESNHLFYNKYNRVFGVGEGYVWDVTYEYETVNGISFRMPAEEVIQKLGEPNSKGVAEYVEALGSWYQTWTYNDLGLDVRMQSEEENMSDATIMFYMALNRNSNIKLNSGIGIGSTKDEVIKAYCVGMFPEDGIYDDGIRVGNIDSNIYFYLEGNNVVGINFEVQIN